MKTILDKINKADEIQASKVELGKHEVELGAIDVWITKYKNAENQIARVKAKIIAANDELGMSLSDLESLPLIGDKLTAQMKELGITQELKNVEDVNNSIKGLVKKYNLIYKNISNAFK
jgi:archaellum component FlaC